MTRMTMAALPMVEEIDGWSVHCQLTRCGEEKWGMSLHIATTLPPTALPKERYPVIATSTYRNAEVPMLATTTAVVLKCELLPISFNIENI